MKLFGLLSYASLICLSALSANAAAQEPAPAPISVDGSGFVIGRLESGAKAYANRPYVWVNVPARFSGWQFTEVKGGKAADLVIRTLDDTDVYIATHEVPPAGWEPVDGGVFAYNDKNGTTMHIYGRHLNGRAVLPVPQEGWAGTLVLAPALTGGSTAPAVEERVRVEVSPPVEIVIPPAVVVTKVHKIHHSERKAERREVVAEKKARKAYARQVRAYEHQAAAQRRYAAAHAPVYRRVPVRVPVRRGR